MANDPKCYNKMRCNNTKSILNFPIATHDERQYLVQILSSTHTLLTLTHNYPVIQYRQSQLANAKHVQG